MAPASRLAARLVDLSHAQLLEIAAAGCEASAEVKNRADAILAAHKPLAQWAVEGVLLSSDLVPHLLAPLQLQDGAAAAVCSRWADGWKATSEGRRRLTRVAFDFPQDLLGASKPAHARLSMAVTGGDEQQLVVSAGSTVRILSRSMSTMDAFECDGEDNGSIAADEQFVYMNVFGEKRLRRLTHAGSEDAEFRDQDMFIICPTLAPGGLLFCVLIEQEDEEQDQIIALDAQTLQPRYRFGLSLLNDVRGMVVVGEELFVCDTGNGRIQVFSLDGEHRRSITGEWKRPIALCFVNDRLYLVEQDADEEMDEEGELIYPLQGRRIFVLSLQGDTLQVYTNPVEGQVFGETLCCFDGKLLAPVQDENSVIVGVVALRGV